MGFNSAFKVLRKKTSSVLPRSCVVQPILSQNWEVRSKEPIFGEQTKSIGGKNIVTKECFYKITSRGASSCERFYGVLLVAVRSYSEGDNTYIQKKILNKVLFKKTGSLLNSHASYSLQNFLLVNNCNFKFPYAFLKLGKAMQP